NLNELLKSQKHAHNREGVGFKKNNSKLKNAKPPIRPPQAQKANKPKRNEAFRQPPKH
ncbi:hypothetical protein PIB30_110326, partial [Stylosanthes scabra]|nr:hypothetical protein [Stylosanthes scabra]